MKQEPASVFSAAQLLLTYPVTQGKQIHFCKQFQYQVLSFSAIWSSGAEVRVMDVGWDGVGRKFKGGGEKVPQQLYFYANEEKPFLVQADTKKALFLLSQQDSLFSFALVGKMQHEGKENGGWSLTRLLRALRLENSKLIQEGKLLPGVWAVCTDMLESATGDTPPWNSIQQWQ